MQHGGSCKSGKFRPTPGVARRVEILLREELKELGVDPVQLRPEEIAAGMRCEIEPDNSMTYIWHDIPILYVTPEPMEDGVNWRMFTRDHDFSRVGFAADGTAADNATDKDM